MVHFRRRSHLSLSLRSKVLNPPTRIHVRLLGPCFKTGQIKPFRQHLVVTKPKLDSQVYLSLLHSTLDWLQHNERKRTKLTPNLAFPAKETHVDTLRGTAPHAETRGNIPQNTTDFIRFPFNNFKYYFTLFSKFFSSFPHGTCSLSVSCRYLALEGIYLPFRAALPSNSTR